MTNRHLTILAAVAAVLAASVLIVGALEDRHEATLGEGSYLLQGFNPEKVYGIFIKNGNESLTFKRRDERFILTGRVDYPVANDRINGLVKAVADIRCAERVTADERNHPFLGVTGDSDSLVIRFFNESGQKITGVVIGKERPGFPGFYTRLEEDKQVYLSTDPMAPVSTNEIDYARCDLPPGNKGDYARIACSSGTGSFALDLKDGRAVLENLPLGKKQDDQAIQVILESLQRFPVRKIYPRDGLSGLTYRTRLEFYRRDGLVFRIELADKDGRMFARTRALMDDRPAAAGKSAPALDANGAPPMHRDLIAAYNRDHDPWVYEISAQYAWLAQRSKTDLLE